MEDNNNLIQNAEEYVCSDCGADVLENDKVCPKCGADLTNIIEPEEEIVNNSTNIKDKSEPQSKRNDELKKVKITSTVNEDYKVVPFHPSDDVPGLLQRIIDSEAINGWKYVNHQYSDKLKPGSAGCFGIGATPDSTVHIGFVIFEKKIK
jgi:hypothetical protein